MTRVLLPLLLLACLLAAQPAPEPAPPDSGPAVQPQPVPASTFGTRIDSVRPAPLFRPKVVVHNEIILPKDPFLAGSLSLIMPGTGQAYCGKWLKGLAFLAGTIIPYGIASDTSVKKTPVISGVAALVGLTMHGWAVFDAVNTANAHNRSLLENP
jgi:hypothetical protein